MFFIYRNRADAAEKMARALKKYKHDDAVILAIPRGGVPIGKKIADDLNLPLDISLVKKVGHPKNKEYAIGAIGLDNEYFNDNDGYVSQDYIEKEVGSVRGKLEDRYHKYMDDKNPIDLKSKTAIIVDDGIATGSTLIATVNLVRKKGAKKIIVAAPVGPPDSVRKLQEIADEVICLETPPDFRAVGQYYYRFEQVTDEEVIDILNQ